MTPQKFSVPMGSGLVLDAAMDGACQVKLGSAHVAGQVRIPSCGNQAKYSSFNVHSLTLELIACHDMPCHDIIMGKLTIDDTFWLFGAIVHFIKNKGDLRKQMV